MSDTVWAAQPRQNRFLYDFRDAFEAAYGGAAGGGKALALDTPLPTPSGWTTMGEVRVGDTLLDERGLPCAVSVVSEVMHGNAVFDVIFDDGSVVRADAGHRWLTSTVASRQVKGRRKRPGALRQFARPQAHAAKDSVVTTAEIAATLRVRGRINHAVAVALPLDLPEASLPIDPYVLGAWLGDGTTADGRFTCDDDEILAEIAGAGYEIRKYADPFSYRILGLAPHLRAAGVLGDKHIPAVYLRASREQRLALLQGLMDTDGTALPSGSSEFYGTNKRLMSNALELILSLGFKAAMCEGHATLRGRDCGAKYRIKFTTATPVFCLPRKRARQVVFERGTQSMRYVVAVSPVASEPVRCVGVDSPSHLFLAGRSFIPTHNTDALLIYQGMRRMEYPGSAGLFLRRSFADLSQPGAALDRFRELFSRYGVKYNANDHVATWPNDSTTKFGYMATDADRIQYQGSQVDDVTFDEVTQFTELQYTYMFSRLRTNERLASLGLKPQFRSAGNPGGIGHAWFKRRFVNTCYDTVFTEPNSGLTRVFVPAKVDDNQALMRANPLYKQGLMYLPEIERRALLDGDWDLFAGQVFAEWRREVHVVPPIVPPAHWRRFIGFDWGYAAPYVALCAAEEPDTRQLVVYREITGSKHHDSEIAARIMEATRGEDVHAMFCDPSIWTKKNGVSTADVLSGTPGWRIPLEPADNDRLGGLRRVHEYLGWKPDGQGGEGASPLLRIGENCRYLIASLPELVHDKIKVEDVDTDGDDHAYDALRYLLMSRNLTFFHGNRLGSIVLMPRAA